MAKKKLNNTKPYISNNTKVLKDAGIKAGEHFDEHVVDRFSKLRLVRRPVLAWLVLIVVLTISVFVQTRQLRGFYIDQVPISGGTLKEGMVGEVSNVNPLYTANSADASISKLIFSSLVEYDKDGQISADLAQKWNVNSTGTVYTFNIRTDAFWHDGQKLSADDVVFTFNMLQHPDAKSPLANSWRGVKVTKEGENSVKFALPNPFAPFLNSLTNVGILPKHILKDIGPDQLRGHRFNLANPIGSGPFQLIESVVIDADKDNIGTGVVRFRLVAHDKYHFGKPRLDSIHLFTYDDREEMIKHFNDGELTLASGLAIGDLPDPSEVTTAETEALEEIEGVEEAENIVLEGEATSINSVPRAAQVMLFLQNTDDILKDVKVRQALSYAIARQAIVNVSDSLYQSTRSPLLSTHLGYNDKYLQPNRNPKKAQELLAEAGWYRNNEDGIRYKNGKQLKITIISQADDIFPEVLATLQSQLRSIGVEVEALLVSSERIQQDFLAEHKFQALLFGINVGMDPDQYVFWHSSQRGLNGRNLSGYNSTTVDDALEAGRTRIDDDLRIAKYETFQAKWVNDTPAIALYQPSYIYTNKKQLKGIKLNIITNPSDRYHNVEDWTINIDYAEKLY